MRPTGPLLRVLTGRLLRRGVSLLLQFLLLGGLTAGPLEAQTGGVVFRDANRNGIQDPGERGIPLLPVRIVGDFGLTDVVTSTDAQGAIALPSLVSGRYLVDAIEEPAYWPSMPSLAGDPPPIPNFPVGRHRFGHTRRLLDAAAAATGSAPLRHVAIGDSVAFGFNWCDSILGQNDYVGPYTQRLGEAAAAATLVKLAIPGYLTDDLLCPSCPGNLFEAIAQSPGVLTINIGGNDFLAADGSVPQMTQAIVTVRQNLQEILATLVSELPDTEIVLNTYYDNEEGLDPFHNTWGPIFDQVLRDVALGQTRPVALAEISAEYAHFDPQTGGILGEPGLICHDPFGLDGIHPTKTGYTVHREKVWEASGGTDTIGGNVPDVRLGMMEFLEARFPTATLDLGVGASNPQAALALDGQGAGLPSGPGEFRVLGFDATPRGLLRAARVSVAYRTDAPPGDDRYRFEAAVDGLFQTPGSTMQTWNTILPIVGSAGNGKAVLLAFPDQPTWRTAGITLTRGVPIDGTTGVGWPDLASLAVRFQGLPQGSPDPFQVEWDAAWVDLYGVPPGRVFWEGDPSPSGAVTIHVTGEAGDSAFLLTALAPAPQPIPVPPFGNLLLDPASLVVAVAGPVGPQGSLAVPLAIPANPQLSGLSLPLQGLWVTGMGPLAGTLTPLESLDVP